MTAPAAFDRKGVPRAFITREMPPTGVPSTPIPALTIAPPIVQPQSNGEGLKAITEILKVLGEKNVGKLIDRMSGAPPEAPSIEAAEDSRELPTPPMGGIRRTPATPAPQPQKPELSPVKAQLIEELRSFPKEKWPALLANVADFMSTLPREKILERLPALLADAPDGQIALAIPLIQAERGDDAPS